MERKRKSLHKVLVLRDHCATHQPARELQHLGDCGGSGVSAALLLPPGPDKARQEAQLYFQGTVWRSVINWENASSPGERYFRAV
jgi:hypothetical protein